MRPSNKITASLLILLAPLVLGLTALAQPGTAPTTLSSCGVTAQTVSPCLSEISDQKPGSVLVYNLYASSATSPDGNDTRISITNTNQHLGIAIHLFLVDGCTCNAIDLAICLTKNQTTSFRASDVDPGTMGFIVAVASNPFTGCPISFNFLLGSESFKAANLMDCSGHRLLGNLQGSLGAEAFPALFGVTGATLPTCKPLDTEAGILFNGCAYAMAPHLLFVDGIPSPADGMNTVFVINHLSGNLAAGATPLPPLFGILYDDRENGFSFSIPGGRCQAKIGIGSLRTGRRIASAGTSGLPSGRAVWDEIPNPFNQAACSNVIIPTGETGALRIDSGEGILGSVFCTPIPQVRGCGVAVAFTPAGNSSKGSITFQDPIQDTINFRDRQSLEIAGGVSICNQGILTPLPLPPPGVGLCISANLDGDLITTPAAVSPNPPPPIPRGNSTVSVTGSNIAIGINPASVTGARNMHKLAFTVSAGFTIPIFPLCDP